MRAVVSFGPFELRLESGALLRAGSLIPIGRRAFRLLEALAGRMGETVEKSVLLDAAWPGLTVEESNLAVQVRALRRLLGPAPGGGEWITTVPRVGYRLAGKAEQGIGAAFHGPVWKTDHPSLAVLPFEALGSDPEGALFADGLADDIVTTLSKLRGLAVADHGASFALKGAPADAVGAATALGVRHALSGSVRRSGGRGSRGRIRVNLRLVDGENGTTIWSEQFDRPIVDVFALQDEITLRLATELQVVLTEGEQARLRYTTTSNVEAWTEWARAQKLLHLPPSRGNFEAARLHLARALALDSQSAALNAALAFVHFARAHLYELDNRAIELAASQAAVVRALSIDRRNAEARSVLSRIRLMEGRYAEAVEEARRALALGPASADVAAFASWVFASTGHGAEALAEIERAIRLSPLLHRNHLGHLGNAYRVLGRTDQAIAAFRAYGDLLPGYGLIDLVILHQEAGDAAAARRTAERLVEVRPDFSVARWTKTQYRSDSAQLARDSNALRAAGLPE